MCGDALTVRDSGGLFVASKSGGPKIKYGALFDLRQGFNCLRFSVLLVVRNQGTHAMEDVIVQRQDDLSFDEVASIDGTTRIEQ